MRRPWVKRLLKPRPLDLLWAAGWLLLCVAFAIGQESRPVAAPDEVEEAGLPHGLSAVFLVERQSCFNFMRQMGITPDRPAWDIQCTWRVQNRYSRAPDNVP